MLNTVVYPSYRRAIWHALAHSAQHTAPADHKSHQERCHQDARMQQDKLAAASSRQYAQDQRPVCKLLGQHIRAMRQQ